MKRIALLLWVGLILAGCEESPLPASSSPSIDAVVPPWERTEDRASCANFNGLRNPYFGDLHIHTRFSADAYIFGTRGDPRDAYTFAQGGTINISDDGEAQTRQIHLDRPLDFAAVTDHAEFYGEVLLCSTPGSALYDHPMCELLRAADDPDDRFGVGVAWLYPTGIDNPPASHAFCFLPGIDCDAAAVSVWQDIQSAAEEAYDRSAACGFTTFIGYEHTASPLGRHLHRNVIFRNHHVPAFAASQLETAADGIPQGVWTAVERDCLDAGIGCDALIIPHNSNLSAGLQLQDPADADEAQRRQDREPLIEIHQMKGNSECRYDRVAQRGVQTEDELCAFEQLRNPHEGPDAQPVPVEQYPARNMVRNALKDGLALQQSLGVNPFAFGFVGSTDTHNATGGNTEEPGFEGGQGNSDSSAHRQINSDVRNNPGGLAVVWAEENSRDAIFAALKRRETYATTGTRPVVRFFGGTLDGVSCERADFIETAYRTGTPMGGELGPVRGGDSPRFTVFAAKDPGTARISGTDLQRIQIIKGWVDSEGTTHERVFEVAGDANNGARVDPATCETVGAGSRELCATWEDPDFDREQRAFYYARILENPTCRWSTITCKANGVDPFASDCAQQARRVSDEFANCCLNASDDQSITPTVQERAWSSPIWYRPEGIAAVSGGVSYGKQLNTDVLDLTIALGRLPSTFDPNTDALSVDLRDNDEVFHVAVAKLEATENPDTYEAPPLVGVETLSLTVGSNAQSTLRVRTAPGDLSSADRVDHSVALTVQLGITRVTHSRTWRVKGSALAPEA